MTFLPPLLERGARKLRRQRVARQIRKREAAQQQVCHEETETYCGTAAAGSDDDGSNSIMTIASWDELLYRMESNSIQSLSLGWLDSNFRLSHGNRLPQLEQVLQKNTSITKVSLGWRVHHRRPDVLVRLLKALPNDRLTEMSFVLDEWVPEMVLRNLLSEQPRLRHLELTSIQVFRRNTVLGRRQACCCTQAANGGGSHQITGGVRAAAARRTSKQHVMARTADITEYSRKLGLRGEKQPQQLQQKIAAKCDHNIVTRVLQPLVPHQFFKQLESLKLQDCHLDDESARALADWTHIGRGLHTLSLRGNKSGRGYDDNDIDNDGNNKLGPRGLTLLCQANVIGHLDLSLCDLDMAAAKAVAAGIAQRHQILGSLSMAGNYRMDTQGLLSLVEPAVCQKLGALDVSFCDVGDHRATQVLQKLCHLSNAASSIALERFVMQGGRLVCRQATEALCQLLRENTPLRVLSIHHKRSPTYLSSMQMKLVVEALSENYEIEQLDVDWRVETRDDHDIQSQKELTLALNQVGRRIFRPNDLAAQPSHVVNDVATVLESAGHYNCEKTNISDNLTLVYWMVRKSPMHVVQGLRG